MMMEEQESVDKLVRIYLKMREKKDALRKAYETAEAELDGDINTVKKQLLILCDTLGTTGLKTAHGTVTRTVKTRYWTSDWASMHKFCVEYGALDLLERRLHQTNMKTFLEEHPDAIPPGLNADSKYDITVRRK
jgi:hypothetical protein